MSVPAPQVAQQPPSAVVGIPDKPTPQKKTPRRRQRSTSDSVGATADDVVKQPQPPATPKSAGNMATSTPQQQKDSRPPRLSKANKKSSSNTAPPQGVPNYPGQGKSLYILCIMCVHMLVLFVFSPAEKKRRHISCSHICVLCYNCHYFKKVFMAIFQCLNPSYFFFGVRVNSSSSLLPSSSLHRRSSIKHTSRLSIDASHAPYSYESFGPSSTGTYAFPFSRQDACRHST